MKKVDLEIHDITLTGSSSGAYTLLLGVVGSDMQLPIVIGGAEAQSIALELENMKSSRPLTHDLYKNTLLSFDMEVGEVLIYKFEEGIFYANIYVSDGTQIKQIDSRVSDAVAIAVRFRAPIRCVTSVIDMAGISPEDMIQMSEEVPEEDADEDLSILSPEPDLDGQKSKKTIRDLKKRISTLKAKLASAVDEENYEKASEIRDMLETLEKNLDEE
jgi:bifunctional DNase/RNase|tara:strand:+ start:207 stop:854 length:648 start_codon:yes stop_codon:yes gene_type:complete